MKFIIPEANRAFVADRLGCDPLWPIGMDDGDVWLLERLSFPLFRRRMSKWTRTSRAAAGTWAMS